MKGEKYIKAFFQEYGPSVILGCVACLLAVMVSPVGVAINSNPKAPTKSTSETKFGAICEDVDLINHYGVYNRNKTSNQRNFLSRIDYYDNNSDRKIVKVKRIGNNYVISDDSPDDIYKCMISNYSRESARVDGYTLDDSKSSYKILNNSLTSTKVGMDYENCLLYASASKGKSVTFDKSGFVMVEGKSTNYDLKMTFNDNYPTDWFSIEVKGVKVDKVSVKKTSDGYILSASNLDNVNIIANNKSEEVQKKISTNYNKLLITENNNKHMIIKIDSNSDGKFNKKLSNSH